MTSQRVRSPRTLPVGPLLDIAYRRALDAETDDAYPRTIEIMAELLGVSSRTVHRWRNCGTVPFRYADECAIRLGLHLELLWPGV